MWRWRETRSASWPTSAASSSRACGRPSPSRPTRAGARPRWSAPSRTYRAQRTASSSSRAPPAARVSYDEREGRDRGVIVALAATAIVVLALLWEVGHPWVERKLEIRRANRARRADGEGLPGYDPGRERRAEQRARELLKSCVNEEEWAMYRDLGFIRVWGGHSGLPADAARDLRGVPYAYLIYPHKPIVAYLPQTGQLLNEYCVEFPDETRPFGSTRLP